jgi:hypothetical protein
VLDRPLGNYNGKYLIGRKIPSSIQGINVIGGNEKMKTYI